MVRIWGVILVLCLSQATLAVDTWPQFRGIGSKGVAEDDPSLPEVWSATRNVAWKTPLPGLGWSSPIVWKDRIFITSAIQEGDVEPPQKGLYFGGERPLAETIHHWMVYCLDAQTGKILWEREAYQGIPKESRHMKNSYASETPVTDGERVYAYFGNIGLFAYDFEGNLLWQKSWDPVKTKAGWGTAASPIFYKGRLYLVNDNDTQSFMVALDARTGEQVWRVDRDEKSNWSTPFIWETANRTELITAGSNRFRSYDLEGKLLWELGGASSITIPTPFSHKDLLFVASGFIMDKRKPLFAVRPGAAGDISLKEGETSNASIAWVQPMAAPYNPSPLAYGDWVYVLLDRGYFSCYETLGGNVVYEKQRMSRGNAYTASPWAYNGKVFCLSEDGETHVIQSGPEFKVLHSNNLGEMCLATPAIANGSLLIRSVSHLYCIRSDK